MPDNPTQPAEPVGAPRRSWLERRRDRYVAEVQRNRDGGHRIPTWVLVLALALMLAGWAAVILFS